MGGAIDVASPPAQSNRDDLKARAKFTERYGKTQPSAAPVGAGAGSLRCLHASAACIRACCAVRGTDAADGDARGGHDGGKFAGEIGIGDQEDGAGRGSQSTGAAHLSALSLPSSLFSLPPFIPPSLLAPRSPHSVPLFRPRDLSSPALSLVSSLSLFPSPNLSAPVLFSPHR
eukprot:3172534-Rhodomonas_salina.1